MSDAIVYKISGNKECLVEQSQMEALCGFRTAAVLFVTILIALIFAVYAVASNTRGDFLGVNIDGVRSFQTHLGLNSLPRFSLDTFSLVFRCLLVTLWAAYVLGVASLMQGVTIGIKSAIIIVAAAVLVMSFCFPPLLSQDVYANISHGRIAVSYGLNPYVQGPSVLEQARDPITRYLTWNMPTIYGPVWTQLEIGVVASMRDGSVWSQVIVMKLIQAAALLTMSLAGRRLAQRFHPERGNLALLAIGLNPLLLLEGPGSGHNDMLLIAFLMMAAVLYLEKKYLFAALCLGLSLGIKPITLAIIPWIVMDYWRQARLDGKPWQKILIKVTIGCLAAALPSLLSFSTLWAGPNTFAAAQDRALYGLSSGEILQDYQLQSWLRTHGSGPGLASLLCTLFRSRTVLVIYAALTVWLWRRPAPGKWLAAWAIFSASLMFFLLNPSFPWYITWFWPICLLRWDKKFLALSALCGGLSLLWMSNYGMVSEVKKNTPHAWITLEKTAKGGVTILRTTNLMAGKE